MDCGPLESRLDRLAASEQSARMSQGIRRVRPGRWFELAAVRLQIAGPMDRLSERT